MSGTSEQHRWNYARRLLGVVICFSPVALLVASLIVGEPLAKNEFARVLPIGWGWGSQSVRWFQ